MRSIFGKCIVIAMMAAIALAWHSPPAYAKHSADERAAVTKARDDARANAVKADAAVAAAKAAATQAEKDAIAAEAAATEAETARDAVLESGATQADQDAARSAAQAARQAADDARAKSGREKTDLTDKGSKAASDAEHTATAWGQYLVALTDAGTEKYQAMRNPKIAAAPDIPEGSEAGDTIPFRTFPLDNKAKAANDEKASVWGNYRATQFEYYALDNTTDAAHTVATAIAAEKESTKLLKTVEAARDEAQKLGRQGGTFAMHARSQANVAERLAASTTAAAVTKAEADLEKAQAKYDVDESLANLTALNDAKKALEDAKTAAATAAAAAGSAPPVDGDDDDDDDDDTTAMMGDTMVTANGVGNLLKFGSWTTLNDRDTLLAVTNPGNAQAMVTVTIKDGMGMMVETFTICLTAGDVWTAALMAADDMQSSTMIIADTGMCDGMSATPPTDMLPLNANYGFIEAYTDMGGMLTGIANVVDAMGGYSSISNAVSLVNFDSDSEAKMADVRAALAMEGDIRKDMLIGRWSATPSNGARTHVVLTFPAGGGPGTEPVRIHVYDQSGMNGSRTFMLGAAVNLCTFITVDGLTTLSCNEGSPLPLSSDQGWFKIMSPDMMMGFPVIGTVTTVYNGSNGMFDQTAPIQWMEDMDATADMAN